MTKPRKKTPMSDIEYAYKKVFSSHEGKVVLDDLMKTLNFGKTVYKSHREDLHFELGRQSVANDIQFILKKES